MCWFPMAAEALELKIQTRGLGGAGCFLEAPRENLSPASPRPRPRGQRRRSSARIRGTPVSASVIARPSPRGSLLPP